MVFRDALGRRLAPLYLATFLGGLALWVPIEKLFMTEIGFTSSSVGIMAAVYAVVVPILEVPSGVLADRWSRRGVLILGTIAVIISVTIPQPNSSRNAYLQPTVITAPDQIVIERPTEFVCPSMGPLTCNECTRILHPDNACTTVMDWYAYAFACLDPQPEPWS